MSSRFGASRELLSLLPGVVRSLLLSGLAAGLHATGPLAGQQAPSTAYVPPLASMLNRPTSELRTVVQRFQIDSRDLGRRWPVEYSAARAAAFRGFLTAWQARVTDATVAGLPNAAGTVGTADANGVVTVSVTWHPPSLATGKPDYQYVTKVVMP